MLLKFVFIPGSAKENEKTLTKGKTPQYWIKRNHRLHLINSLNWARIAAFRYIIFNLSFRVSIPAFIQQEMFVRC